jgi:hypothetical protein
VSVIKIWSLAPDGCFIPRQTGRLTVGRNITLTLLGTVGYRLGQRSTESRITETGIGELGRVLESRLSKAIEEEMASRLHSDLK